MSQMKRDEARIMNAAKGRLSSLPYLEKVFGRKYGQDQLDRVTARIMALPLPGEFGTHLDLGRGKKKGGVVKMRGGGMIARDRLKPTKII